MDELRHAGVAAPVRQVTQLALLARLVALVLVMVSSLGTEMTFGALIGYVVIGATSFMGLMWTRWLDVVRRHPMISLLDAALVAGSAAMNGTNSPMVLAALTTALLLGLWVDVRAGLIVIPLLVLLYLLGVTQGTPQADEIVLTVVVIPFVYVMLWLLGLTIRRAVSHEQTSAEVMRDAVATAAAAQERTAVARELHDSLAKTLQGISLSATAMPALIARHPEGAVAAAAEMRQMSVVAVNEVRQVMNRLRERTADEPLSQALLQLTLEWELRTGRELERRIEPVDTEDDSVRYELLMVVQECLDNVHRHAGECRARVELGRVGDEVVLAVQDWGRGFDEQAQQAARTGGHHGITGVHERMARIGGHADWESQPGHGTRVVCRVHQEGLMRR